MRKVYTEAGRIISSLWKINIGTGNNRSSIEKMSPFTGKPQVVYGDST